ncbi:MAG: hypothetical protein HRU77_02740 [Gammaproteobacteria bacterium]|nr:MAG: hypothetical protein HRU77_02740 [Gammaproteobacteria bacterium]
MKPTEQQAIIDRNRKAAVEQEKQIVSWHLSQQGVCIIDQMFFLNNDRARGALFPEAKHAWREHHAEKNQDHYRRLLQEYRNDKAPSNQSSFNVKTGANMGVINLKNEEKEISKYLSSLGIAEHDHEVLLRKMRSDPTGYMNYLNNARKAQEARNS